MTTTGLLTRTLLLGSLLAPALAIAEESEKTPRWNEALIEAAQAVTLGPRPLFLVNDMSAGNAHEQALKASLLSCAAEQTTWHRSPLSIGHRGAPLQFPEHTLESYIAGAQGGAGILECDVAFTADEALVCRHSQCDLHATTNIVETALAEQCSVPPAFDDVTGALTNAADIRCCTSDITLADFHTLQGKMEGVNSDATSIEEYVAGTPGWRTDLYASRGTLMSHADSIALFQQLGVMMAPELKSPEVDMPFTEHTPEGFTQQAYAQKMIDEYKAAGVSPDDVFPQSFDIDDVLYWIEHEPAFGRQAVYLEGRYGDEGFDHTRPETWQPSMASLVEHGVRIIAPPTWMLVEPNPAFGNDAQARRLQASRYARRAREAGLDIIAWTFERSGPLGDGGQWYHRTTGDVIQRDGDKLLTLDTLVNDVGAIGVFSDWPATVTFYDNCVARNAP
ncbi:MAG: glycerophosphodiester phosphodiesterase [Halomonas sp.]|uniref:glycerophosphodiester phosphodiesterase family protein n=2 Tax=Bacteria TaxID=2 RepID=UPI000733914D|nr:MULTISPECIES: glycerophosphodiester phosphodiesterase family protein [Halomonas]KTG24378.1 glycerophosphodiester phosphodiesterase [Idiomarina sp. H105]OAE90201.1 glycerophosphodiester phosphodiesterase [Idiomarina sp. WRN-38]MBV66398.1 glycerophosphodiester phosphodiesterase [Halomonas sp.]MCC4291225.1 glycerophosphodiester phosphodiesterase [Halomonas axialensis]MCF2913649.1 glycerophosphodiester phosphodiesterase [Halomonas sp. Cn5-12]